MRQWILKFIESLDFCKEKGLYYPVNISSYSAFPDEKEVVFPSFYPIKIIDISNQKINKRVIVQAPFSVYIPGKSLISKPAQQENLEYLEEILELTAKKVINEINLSNFI